MPAPGRVEANLPATNFVPQLDLIEGLAPTRAGLAGIIDIGSNSIRLVVYQGLSRVPPVIFNEKVMAGLGRGVANDGKLDAGGSSVESQLRRSCQLPSKNPRHLPDRGVLGGAVRL